MEWGEQQRFNAEAAEIGAQPAQGKTTALLVLAHFYELQTSCDSEAANY
jgi:hypothetical protein